MLRAVLNAGDRRAALVISAGSNRRASHVSPDKKLLWAERQRQLGARQLSRPKAVRMITTQGCDQTLRVWAKSELPGFFWKSVGFPLRFSRRWARFPAKLLETCFFKPPKFPKKLLETLSQGKSITDA